MRKFTLCGTDVVVGKPIRRQRGGVERRGAGRRSEYKGSTWRERPLVDP